MYFANYMQFYLEILNKKESFIFKKGNILTTQQEILDLIKKNEGITQAALQKVFNGSKGNVNDGIMRLKKKKVIIREAHGKTWKLYSTGEQDVSENR